MREISKSALVPYTPQQMFALVADIQRYPEFLPWCLGAQILERSDHEVTATLELGKGGFREKFTSRNLLSPPERMQMKLVEGPFKILEGTWSFTPIQDQGQDRGARVNLDMRFEFANAMTGMLLSGALEKNFGSLIDAFTARAHSVYGKTPTSA